MWAFFSWFKNQNVVWCQPQWSYVPALWREWSQLMQPLLILRTLVAAALIFGLIVAGFKIALPQLPLGFLWRAPIVALAPWACLALMGPLYCAIPPSVELRANRICIQHGQHAHLIWSSSIVSTHMTIFAADRIRLRINYRIRDKLRRKLIGIPPKIDLQKICDLLPIQPVVHDARKRYASFLDAK